MSGYINREELVVIPMTALVPTTVTSESVTIPSGAAGTVVNFYFARHPILDANNNWIGGDGSTSISFTSTTLTNEVPAGTADSAMANGDYWIDYVTGKGRVKKADSGTSVSATYAIFLEGLAAGGTITGDVTITGDLTVQGDFIFGSVSAEYFFLGDGDVIAYGNTSAAPDFVMGVNASDSDALTLSLGGTLGTANVVNVIKASGIVEFSRPIQWDAGVAVTAGSYMITRDADATNQLHFNVPTGAGYELSVNDVAQMVLTADLLSLNTQLSFTDSLSVNVAAWQMGRDGGDILYVNVPTGEEFAHYVNGSTVFMQGGTTAVFTQLAGTGGSPIAFTINGGIQTTLAVGTEASDIFINLAREVEFARGAITTQRAIRFAAPSYDMDTASSTITNAMFIDFGGAPNIASTNINFTNTHAFRFGANASIGATSSSKMYDVIEIPNHTVTVTGTTQVTASPSFTNMSIGITTITDASAATFDRTASLYIAGPHAAGGSVTITDALSFWVDAGPVRFDGRFLQNQGADIGSANDLTLGSDGNSFEITGTTQINAITTTGWMNGSLVTLFFTSNPTVKHNTAGGGGTAVLLLAGSSDFSATAGDVLTLRLSEIGGTQAWREIARTAI